jgi:hypothetical protein
MMHESLLKIEANLVRALNEVREQLATISPAPAGRPHPEYYELVLKEVCRVLPRFSDGRDFRAATITKELFPTNSIHDKVRRESRRSGISACLSRLAKQGYLNLTVRGSGQRPSSYKLARPEVWRSEVGENTSVVQAA